MAKVTKLAPLKVFAARFSSRCARCSKAIAEGDRIAIMPGSGAVHEQCVPEIFRPETTRTGEGGAKARHRA